MDHEDEPQAKRRKLCPIEFTSIPESFSNYFSIAGTIVPVAASSIQVNGLDLQKYEYKKINVKHVTEAEGVIQLSFSAPGFKLNQSLCISSIDNDRLVQLVKDSEVLESSARNISRKTQPLAVTYTVLHIHRDGLYLEIRLLWHDTAEIRDRVKQSHLEILRRYLPSEKFQTSPTPEDWDPRQFYDNVHVPEKSSENSADLKIDLLQSQLYPFQRRAVRWLLNREGVVIQPSGVVLPIPAQHASDLPPGFCISHDFDNKICYLNSSLGVVCSDLAKVNQTFRTNNGGILADEMGLGKTLEIIALICSHQKLEHETSDTTSPPIPSRSTLIITPPTILEQWKQEINEHAPSLKVYHYEGIKPSKQNLGKVVETLLEHDVVLTTYNVISKEVHYVAEKPDRNLRHRPRVEPPKSPLTEVLWWRVCLDEAQMVESGVSAAATVARLIPRVNAWAVTGTPLRKGHRDLFGLLLFLGYKPWCHSAHLWDNLISYHRSFFRKLINNIAIRHNKDFVREDLRLPPQSRHTITIPFTAVEEQHYSQLVNDLCEDCDLDETGAPRTDEWDPESPVIIEKMRSWLTRLRQTCLHPEVGFRNRKALGRGTGPLRTVQQVLDVMIEQNESSYRSEQRNLLSFQIKRGQMQENAKHTQLAMGIWQSAYQASRRIVDECRQQLETEIILRKDLLQASTNKDTLEDDEEAELDTQLQSFRQRLRSALETQHICIFFIANAYFQLKSDEINVKPESEEFFRFEKLETAAYEEAKSIRGELLFEVLRKANRLISNVTSRVTEKGLATIPDLQYPSDYAGIESRKIFDKLFHYCEAMNKHATWFREVRQKMTDFLRQALIDEDEGVELQGDEYESSTKHQDEMYAYMEALRAMFADRSDAISGQENLLIRQEMKGFLKSAKEGQGPAPELMLKFLGERDEKRVKPEQGSLRGIATEIRQLVTSLQWQESGGSTRARSELVISTKVLTHVQELISTQTKFLPALEQEVNFFRDTMNSRLDYYRALQKISDTVAPYDEEHVGQPLRVSEYQSLLDQEQKLQAKVSSILSKRRYLLHLKMESSSDSPRICTICQSEFEIGTLTVCGHQFCKECIQLWWAEHRNCPVCKKKLHMADFHDITYKPAELAVQAESPASNSNSPGLESDRSLNQSIYSDISTATLNEIKNIDIAGVVSFGSKVDFICRHLFWLREHDPGSKIIIFSQYREFLDVLGRAFKQYAISFSRFDDRNGIEKFKSDPVIECFLLHAKAHSTGLNLVVANHVFLCEPLINTAIELQAIARVHRIGQHRATTVWMYLIADTVEEAIYEISVARRLAHVQSTLKLKDKNKSRLNSRSGSGTSTPRGVAIQENAIDAANSLELQAADLSKMLISGKSGGEMVEKEDLWPCLFGKAKKRESVLLTSPDRQPANGDVARFLRQEAAQMRADCQS